MCALLSGCEGEKGKRVLSDNFLAVPNRLVRVQEVPKVVLLLTLLVCMVESACLDVVGGWSEIKHLIPPETFRKFRTQVSHDSRGIYS